MMATLHDKLKRLYPMNEVCRLIDAHFARLDGLDRRVSEIPVQDLAANDSALLEGISFLIQQLKEHENIYRQLEQRQERDGAASRRTASLIEALNSSMAGWEAHEGERASRFTSALEQLAEVVRGAYRQKAEAASVAGALQEQLAQLRAATVEELQCLRSQMAQLSASLGESSLQPSGQLHEGGADPAEIVVQKAQPAPPPAESNGHRTFDAGRIPAAVELAAGEFEFENPDIVLLTHLAPLIPNRTALDIGANIGAVSSRLLAAGYEVFAFEPFPPVFACLQGSLGNDEHFHGHQLAIGYSDRAMSLHIAEDLSATPKYSDLTLYSSLIPHSMPSDLQFTRNIDVRVRSLDSLARAKAIPSEVGVIKIDTEGYDLEVVRGMGACSSQVLLAEFWDANMIFGKSGAMNRLSDLAGELHPRGYRWHIVFYRLENKPISYYCNLSASVRNSWGNVLFFREKQLFEEARQWCAAVLPQTYFIA